MNGCAEALERYGPSAFSLALCICTSPAQAEQVTYEAFLSIWPGAGGPDPGHEDLGAYLFAAVHNRAVAAVRCDSAGVPQRAGWAQQMPTGSDRDEDIEGARVKDRRQEVCSAMLALPDFQRQALGLAYFQALSCSEVAGRLGIPPGTAKAWLREGMTRLRQQLDSSADPRR